MENKTIFNNLRAKLARLSLTPNEPNVRSELKNKNIALRCSRCVSLKARKTKNNYTKLKFIIDNGISQCRKCHYKEHGITIRQNNMTVRHRHGMTARQNKMVKI
jgi:hypothetical protein